jgi:hypothetical protein
LPLSRQCELAGITRATVYAQRHVAAPDEQELILLGAIDAEYTRYPFYGSRKMTAFLCGKGHHLIPQAENTPFVLHLIEIIEQLIIVTQQQAEEIPICRGSVHQLLHCRLLQFSVYCLNHAGHRRFHKSYHTKRLLMNEGFDPDRCLFTAAGFTLQINQNAVCILVDDFAQPLDARG